ncbi:Inner membrane protein translocase and chaperone YidC, long form [hydrothermal vent metagenome]|uniref:Membrane protein insertase YidC n=1 Tax=hydrothermal vent metagenome TaxID=652676 RepID=A0A3B1E4G8_9ZZZZ
MEKRLLLAFILSFLVLSAWSAFMPKTTPRQNFLKEPQSSENKEIIENTIKVGDIADSLPAEVLPQKIEEEIKVVESEKLSVRFSNMGGSLKGVDIKEYGATLPITDITHISGYEDYIFSLESDLGLNIVYSYEDADYKISKIYEISPDDYTIQAEIKIYNKTDSSRLDNINIEGFSISTSRLDKKDKDYMRDRALLEYVIYSSEGFQRKNKAFKFSHKEKKEVEGGVQWIGFRDRYFSALIKPHFDVSNYSINPLNDKKLIISMAVKDIKVTPGASVSLASTIYFGPEKTGVLKKYDLEFEKIKRYYKFGVFDVIAKLISNIMNMLYKIFHNWGVCIIFISIIIYFSMYPMTMRSMQSMRKMQAIQPKLISLKEKNKNSPQKLNKEMMELYKKHGVNPVGGCLPMVLQLPVFIGLYQVLWRSVSFKGASFLWIKDLSAPDRLFALPFSIPFLGSDFNILPILMIFIMAFQQKLTAKNMVATTPEQKAQQKMMATIMPLLMGVIFYKFASGLTLYFTMFYLFSTLTQWKMAKTNAIKVA